MRFLPRQHVASRRQPAPPSLTQLVFGLGILSLLFPFSGCDQGGANDNTTPDLEVTKQALGFAGHSALQLEVEEPYLYVSAGSEGLWRRNLRQAENDWLYLGLADPTLKQYPNVGAVSVDVAGDDILVAYNGATLDVNPDSTVSIWRSLNGGQSWFRSDSGIPETLIPQESNSIFDVRRSPHSQGLVLGIVLPAVYQSSDGGSEWRLTLGERGVIVTGGKVRWHPYQPGEAWIFGETTLFSPYLAALRDNGAALKTTVDFQRLGFPSDGYVTDVAFSALNPAVIYAATVRIGMPEKYKVIVSEDGGYMWSEAGFKLPEDGYVTHMLEDPDQPGALYLAGGEHIYYTEGISIFELARLEQKNILSLAFAPLERALIVGTHDGVYMVSFRHNN